jgi:hypothetical protein
MGVKGIGMSRTAWRWVVVVTLVLNVLNMLRVVLSSRNPPSTDLWWFLVAALVFAAGSWLWLGLRKGGAGIVEAIDRQAAPMPAFSEDKKGYLVLLAAWIVFGVWFSYCAAFAKH